MAKVFAALSLVGVVLAQCPSYSCGIKNSFPENQCVIANLAANSLLINPCRGVLECNTTDAISDFYCVMPTPVNVTASSLYPGESCSSSAECINNFVCNSTCIGYGLNHDCFDSDECNPGLRCDPDSAVCAPTLSIGQNGCYNDFDCMNGAGCNKPADASTGTCVGYYSLNNGISVSNCNDDTMSSNLCASGSCNVTSELGTEGVCVPGFVSPFTEAKSCNYDTDCQGQNSQGLTVNGTCSCGYNVNGKSYCDLYTGDANYKKYIHYLVKYFSSPLVNSVCNVNARFNDNCMERAMSLDTYYFLKQYEYSSQNFPEIQANDACVRATYLQAYWDLYNNNQDIDDKDEHDDDDSAAVLVVGVLVFFL